MRILLVSWCFKDLQLDPNLNSNLTKLGFKLGSDVWTPFICKLFEPQLTPRFHFHISFKGNSYWLSCDFTHDKDSNQSSTTTTTTTASAAATTMLLPQAQQQQQGLEMQMHLEPPPPSLIAVCKKLDKTQIDTKLAHETCAGNISRTNCLIAPVSFVSHSPTCTAGPGALNCYDFYIHPSLASSCLNLRQIEANWGRACEKWF